MNVKQQMVIIIGMIALALAGGALAQESAPTTQPSSSADQLLDRMLKSGSASETLAPATNESGGDTARDSSAVAPEASKVTVMREGSHIVDRVARLSPSRDGQQMLLVFESDGQALQDPPMTVLPSLKLMDMEWARQTKGSDTKFRVTGMVTEYKGHNYILLDKVVVITEPQVQ